MRILEGTPSELAEFLILKEPARSEQGSAPNSVLCRKTERKSDTTVGRTDKPHKSDKSGDAKERQREYQRKWYEKHKAKKGLAVSEVKMEKKPELGAKYEYCVGCDKAVRKKDMQEVNGDQLCPDCVKKVK